MMVKKEPGSCKYGSRLDGSPCWSLTDSPATDYLKLSSSQAKRTKKELVHSEDLRTRGGTKLGRAGIGMIRAYPMRRVDGHKKVTSPAATMITGCRGSTMLQPTTSFVSSMPDPFPQELVDRIIDEVQHVYPDETHCKAIWKACSSVCRSWRTRAMHHLVRSFSLDLSDTRRNTTIKGIQALHRFIKFEAPPKFPASFVTRVCIRCIYKFKIVQEVMCSLHLYPNLRELNLHGVHFSDFSRSKIKTLSKALDSRFPLPPLDRLELDCISFIDFEHLLSFIGMSHFSALSALKMYSIEYKGNPDGDWSECVSVKHDPQFGGPSFATSLSLREGYQNTGPPFTEIIGVLGKSITELELEIYNEQHFDFDFDPNLYPSLRRLSLTFGRLSLSVLTLFGRLTDLKALTHFSFGVDPLLYWIGKPDARNKVIEGLDHALTPISRMPSIQEIVVPKLPGASESLIESRKTGLLVEEDWDDQIGRLFKQ
ncbi:hypothetical protein K435DRAFT_961985 [Dendrothele bispora CBS 962.96]|uniref:Uncharacterized protein n=1 Tax=Dendrothele bispora (strain CBS 962.96) TaxID=1314807 RepID=A0A4S8MN51_DENBC|nr:hypothetical protein K435DRAFT_961985 [Dendrothele bispora CBS 962.96]